MGKEKKLSPAEVLSLFFDEGSFVELDACLKGDGADAEAIAGFGTADGVPVFAFAQNVEVAGGAMSKAQSKKITRLYDQALKVGAPIVGFYNSVGGRLEQKYDMLAAYGDILRKSSKLSGVVPQISVVLGSCIGAASLIAASADFIIMEKDACLTIETAKSFGTAEANADSGTAQFIADGDAEAVAKAKELLSYFPSNNLEAAPSFESAPAYEAPDRLPKYIADDASLLCVGAGYGDDACTAFGRVAGRPVGFVVTNGGNISAEAAKKIAKHVRFCDAFSIPVITLVNAESFDNLSDASALVSAYADATTAKISVITGTAFGSVYIALAGTTSGSDFVYALPEAIVSPISPYAATYILAPEIAETPYVDQDAAMRSFVFNELTALKAAEDGYVDDIVDKTQLRDRVSAALDLLSSKRVATLPKKHTTK